MPFGAGVFCPLFACFMGCLPILKKTGHRKDLHILGDQVHMFRKLVVLFVFMLLSTDTSSALAEGASASFLDEIRLSCRKYAVEDQIPPEELEAYVDLCVRDFNTPQPSTGVSPLEGEEGIANISLVDDLPLAETSTKEGAAR